MGTGSHHTIMSNYHDIVGQNRGIDTAAALAMLKVIAMSEFLVLLFMAHGGKHKVGPIRILNVDHDIFHCCAGAWGDYSWGGLCL
jgi:hypothetical protein